MKVKFEKYRYLKTFRTALTELLYFKSNYDFKFM